MWERDPSSSVLQLSGESLFQRYDRLRCGNHHFGCANPVLQVRDLRRRAVGSRHHLRSRSAEVTRRWSSRSNRARPENECGQSTLLPKQVLPAWLWERRTWASSSA